MDFLKERLAKIFRDAVSAAGFDPPAGAELVRPSDRPDLSDFQSNVALALGKIEGSNPRAVAESIAANIKDGGVRVSVDGPGFINMTLDNGFVAEAVAETIAAPDFGVEKASDPKNIVVDYGGPNVAKALHVGHLRPAVIGEALIGLARFKGHRVTGDAHLGDWGLPMGMLIAAIKEKNLPLPVDVDALNRLYPEASRRSKEDEEFMSRAREETKKLQDGDAENRRIWKSFVAPSVEGMRKIYDSLLVRFDLWLGESDADPFVRELIPRFRAGGFTRMSDGAEIIDLSGYPMNGAPVPPFIMVKSNGAVMYGMTDVATLYDRVENMKADMVWYVAGTPQALHFHQVFSVAKITGIAGGASFEHLGNGSVLGSDGKPFKTRSGDTAKLEDLVSDALALARKRVGESAKELGAAEAESVARAVAVAAIKFADLVNPRASDYVFDLDKFVSFEGKTGPYVLYTAVRIKSMLANFPDADTAAKVVIANGCDKALAMKICGFAGALDKAFDARAVHVLVQYAYELAVVFSAFYHRCSVLREEDAALRKSRLALSAATLGIFEIFADIIKIEIPERM
ncbi:MAG: arginine--tRNA ligase [Rickettsiales bacterium]|jgi:arginyl-tRNA synthetase|nr:arginine--tRNA ligase [Rickettsiales bacterium]